jgi:carnitine O-acetyltransferase
MDGTPTLRMNEFMLASLAANKIDLGPARAASTGSGLPAPRELAFVLDAASKRNVADAEARFDALVGAHDMAVLHYEGYGKEQIKKFRASPDAWVQLVKQLAFHKMFGRPGVCYESAQTRKYQLGRTEVIRSASNESKAWAEAMLNPDETVGCLRCVRVAQMYSSEVCPRTNTVLHYSAVLLLATCSTPRGQPMGKGSIAISSG